MRVRSAGWGQAAHSPAPSPTRKTRCSKCPPPPLPSPFPPPFTTPAHHFTTPLRHSYASFATPKPTSLSPHLAAAPSPRRLQYASPPPRSPFTPSLTVPRYPIAASVAASVAAFVAASVATSHRRVACPLPRPVPHCPSPPPRPVPYPVPRRTRYSFGRLWVPPEEVRANTPARSLGNPTHAIILFLHVPTRAR